MKVYFPIHGTGSIEEMRNRDKDLVDLSMAGIVSVHCPYSVVGTMAGELSNSVTHTERPYPYELIVDVCSSIPANQTAQLPHYGPIPTNWNGSLTFPSNKVVIVTKSNDFAYLVSSLRNKDIAVILLTAEDAHVHLVARATEKKVWKNFFEAPNSRVKDF